MSTQTTPEALGALRRLADAIRERYPEAGILHVALGDPAAGINVTEVYDARGRRLDGEDGAQEDDWQHVGHELRVAVDQASYGVDCDLNWQCARHITLPRSKTPTALETWRGTVERVLDVDQAEIGAWVYDVHSAEQDHTPIAAGVVHLPAGTDPDSAAAILREAFERITGDASLGVTVVSRHDDGGTDWSGRGVAEPE